MRRFFTDQPLTAHTDLTLCESSFHHWVRVLRAQVGDVAVMFNGKGGEYTATLTEVSKKSATVLLGEYHDINRDNPFRVTLALVMSKGDRMDYALQKSTELGVHHIQLLTSERCDVKLSGERLTKKLKNWQGVVHSACEQSGLNIVPQVFAPQPLNQFLQSAEKTSTVKNHINLVLAPTPDGTPNLPFDLSTTHSFPNSICLLVGPEGGLTADEISLANAASFVSWCLGERILRTETAPVATLSMLVAMHAVFLAR